MDADGGPALPDAGDDRLPALPGFREMALRRMSEQRRGLVAELAGRRRAAGISQTEIAARMGTSQSAVARLEAGEADVRASTLERYAAAVGTEVSWQLDSGQHGTGEPGTGQFGAGHFGTGQFETRRAGDPPREG